MTNYDRQLEFEHEYQLVAYIRDNLTTVGLAHQMSSLGVTIEDVLNGRLWPTVEYMYEVCFDTWNNKLGRKEFGF